MAVTDALTQRKALSAMVAWALASQATTPSPLPCAAMAHNGAARRVLRGIVFDMDGTLTVPCIDFAEMRRRVGVTTGDILHEIDNWSAERRETAHKILVEIETEANVNMKVMPGTFSGPSNTLSSTSTSGRRSYDRSEYITQKNIVSKIFAT